MIHLVTEADNVVPISKQPEVHRPLVEYLEKQLEAAKAGKVVGILLCTQTDEGIELARIGELNACQLFMSIDRWRFMTMFDMLLTERGMVEK